MLDQHLNPFQKDFEDQSLRSLYRKMKKTAMARFECAARMRRHQTFSLWSITIFSTGLIVFPLIQAFGIPVRISIPWLNVIQVVMALMVLVLSLLISVNHVGDKAEKMHRCASEINALCHEALPLCRDEKAGDEKYDSLRSRYAQILNVYENHQEIDFDKVKLMLPEEYPPKWFSRPLWIIRSCPDYWVYGLLMIVLFVAFYATFFRES